MDSRLIRISTDWHRTLKIESARRGESMMSLIDKVCDKYFESASKNEEVNL